MFQVCHEDEHSHKEVCQYEDHEKCHEEHKEICDHHDVKIPHHEEVKVLPELRLAFLEGRLYVLVVELLVIFDIRQVLVAVQNVKVL